MKRSHAALRTLTPLLLFACAGVGCTRELLVPLVPKLALRVELRRAERGNLELESARWQRGLSAWLRWQPTIAARQVAGPAELSSATVLAPCEPEDAVCLAEVAEVEQELAGLRDVR